MIPNLQSLLDFIVENVNINKVDVSGCYHPDLYSALSEFEYILYTKYPDKTKNPYIKSLLDFIRIRTKDKNDSYHMDVLLVSLSAFTKYIEYVENDVSLVNFYTIFDIVSDLLCFDSLDQGISDEMKLIRVAQSAKSRKQRGMCKPHNKTNTISILSSIKPCDVDNIINRELCFSDLTKYKRFTYLYDLVSVYLKMNPFVMISNQKAHQKAYKEELIKRVTLLSKFIESNKSKCGEPEVADSILKEAIYDTEFYEQIKCFLIDK